MLRHTQDAFHDSHAYSYAPVCHPFYYSSLFSHIVQLLVIRSLNIYRHVYNIRVYNYYAMECQVLLYFSHGPLLRSWCMRYEAKHHYFKHLSTIIGNYKNISYTLAMCHQHWLCYMQQTGNHESSFIEKGLEIPSGKIFIHTSFVHKGYILAVVNS